MHIIIGLISAIAGLFWALSRLQNSGVNIPSLNPFNWYKRHQWKQQFTQNPLHNLSTSFELGSVLILGMAKLAGEITREMKEDIIKIYQETFHLSEKQAISSFTNSSFLLKDEINLQFSVKRIIQGAKEKLTKEQIEYLLNIIAQVSQFEGEANEYQLEYYDVITKELIPAVENVKW